MTDLSDLAVDAMLGRWADDGPGELPLRPVLHREDGAHGRSVGNLDFEWALKATTKRNLIKLDIKKILSCVAILQQTQCPLFIDKSLYRLEI